MLFRPWVVDRDPRHWDAESGRELMMDSRIAVASLTKPVLATAAVWVWRERGIDVDAPLVELLPRLAPVCARRTRSPFESLVRIGHASARTALAALSRPRRP